MTTADVRDMLDLPAAGHPRPVKKQKITEKRPEGITRELYQLLGERAPPVSLTEHIKYKEKPKLSRSRKVRPWEMTAFSNPARTDNLVLRHWRMKKSEVHDTTPVNTSADTETPDDQKNGADSPKAEGTEAYPWARYNIKVNVPQYTDEQYANNLQSETWSKEETDYLVETALEYDLRWPIIVDRYEYQPPPAPAIDEKSMEVIPTLQPRTMEDLKYRYYTVAAKMLALHHPPSTMSTAEFDLYEKMTKFSPKQETQRKELGALLLERTPDEVKEEEALLVELKRIVNNEERFNAERQELYARLDAPISTGNTTMYQSSQGLGQLLQSLLQVDKSKKRRSLIGPEGASGVASSPAGQSGTHHYPSNRDSQADTPTAGTSNKKSSLASSNPTVRTLTPAEEQKYGVSHHDRLTSGVHFRNEKAVKLVQLKSNAQSQKLTAAINELRLPARLVMPTERVVREFERLVQSINLLLETRKVSEKVESEIKVLEAARAERLGLPKEKEKDVVEEMGDKGVLEPEVNGVEEENKPEKPVAEHEEDDGEEDAEGEEEEKENEDEDEDAPGEEDEDGNEEEDADAEAEAEAELGDEEEEEDAEGDDDDDGDDDDEDGNEGNQDENGADEDEDEVEVEGDDEDGSAPMVATRTAIAQGRKRSQSVLSGSSSNRSTKKSRRLVRT